MPDFLTLYFFRTLTGREPVREWLQELPSGDRRAVGQDLQRLQYRWPVGMPLARHLVEGVWEVRSDLREGKIARVLFCAHNGALYALHGFIKKTQKTPLAEIRIARQRMKALKGGKT